jgi:hypothetical protein
MLEGLLGIALMLGAFIAFGVAIAILDGDP